MQFHRIRRMALQPLVELEEVAEEAEVVEVEEEAEAALEAALEVPQPPFQVGYRRTRM